MTEAGRHKPVLAVRTAPRRASAVKAVRQAAVQRCQQHKIRNVIDKLPDRLKQVTERRSGRPTTPSSAKAEGELEQLARELDKTHPARRPACGRA